MSKINGNIINPSSIRQIVLTALTALQQGKTTAEITTLIQAAHPNSAAAAKPTKHIAWYRAYLKKNPATTETETTA